MEKWLPRLAHNQKNVGSNPTSATMIKFNKFLKESEEADILLRSRGYINKFIGTDRHITYTNTINKKYQILLDIGGNEWHYEVNGSVKKVGKLSDDSLKKFLS